MNTQHAKSAYTLTKNEVQNLINSAATFEHRLILKLLYHAGMRVDEVNMLDIADIDFFRNNIIVRQGKRKKMRIIPIIDGVLKSDLRHYIGLKYKGKLFNVKKRMMQRIVQKTGEIANINHPDPTAKHLNAHLLRHSIARHLKSDGYPAEFIKNFLGHSSIKTTYDTYGTMGLQEMQEVVYRKTKDALLVPQVPSKVPEIMHDSFNNTESGYYDDK